MGEQILRYEFNERYQIKYKYKYPKQKDFVKFILKKEWTDVHRVQISERTRRTIGDAFDDWCNENVAGRWSKSDGNEVFYFESLEDALHFRLRWTGQIPEVPNP